MTMRRSVGLRSHAFPSLGREPADARPAGAGGAHAGGPPDAAELLWERTRLRQALARSLAVDDPEVLDRIIDLGIREDTALAFQLVPLVEVAWADGRIARAERVALLEAAVDAGVELGDAAHGQLETWLDRPPTLELFAVWRGWARAARSHPLGRLIVERAADVASAAGGLFAISRASRREQRVLDRLEATLAATGPQP